MKKIQVLGIITIILTLFFCSGAQALEENYWISIDPIDRQAIGFDFLITGKTNVPVDTSLWVSLIPERNDRSDTVKTWRPFFYAGGTFVQSGENGNNIWNFTVNATNLINAKYVVEVMSMDPDLMVTGNKTTFRVTPYPPMMASSDFSSVFIVPAGILGFVLARLQRRK